MAAENINEELLSLIEKDPNGFLEKIDEWKLGSYDSMFISYLYSLMESKGIKIKQLIYNTSMSQSYIYQIASGRRHMGRNTALILAAAMRLDLEQTQTFLRYSCNAPLCPSIRRDAVIICCVCRGMTYEETDELLTRMGEQGLV